MRNSGSVIGGAINFSTNHSQARAGGIAWSTYLIFVGFGTFELSLGCVASIIDGEDGRMYRCYLGGPSVAYPARPASQRSEGSHVWCGQLEKGACGLVESFATEKSMK